MKDVDPPGMVPQPNTSQPVRVLHICGALAGGVGSVLLGYYRRIDRTAVQFDFLTHHDPDPAVRAEVELMGGTINVVTPKSHSMSQNIHDARTFINRRTPHEVVHVHTASPTSVIYLIVALLAGKRMRIAHSHATHLEVSAKTWQHRLHRLLRPLLRWAATDHFACSMAAGGWLFGDTATVRVIPNAIEADLYRFNRADRGRLRRELLVEDRLVIGHVGRFVEQKNHRFLVEIFAEIVRRAPQAVMLLVGTGPLHGDVRRQVTQLGLDGSVHYLGERDDVSALLNAMDVFVLPSNFEGLPLVLVEAQASGLPCLASTAVTREVALTSLVRFASLAADPEHWADQILEIVARPQERIIDGKLADAGYDIKTAAPQLAEFYLDRVHRWRNGRP